MIRHALYATLVGLISLSASAQEAAQPELLGGQQQPSAAPATKAQAVGQPSAGPAAAESGSDQKPTAEQGSAPQAAKPDPQAPTSAAAEPKPEKQQTKQQQADVPATTAAGPKPQKQAAVKPRAKQPKHAAQRGRNGPAYYGGYRDPRPSYRWAWSPWYGFYRYRPRHYAYYSYYPRYRY